MPLTVTHNALDVIKKIGLPQYLYDWLVASSIKVTIADGYVKFEPIGLTYYCPGQSVPIKVSQLNALKNNTLLIGEKLLLQGALKKTIEKLKALLDAKTVLQEKFPDFGLVDHVEIPAHNKPVEHETWGLVNPEDMIKLERVKLIKADALYAPVFGTSAYSRYYVVALSKGLRVAARINDESVSMRAEGSKFKESIPHLLAAGFNVNSNSIAGDYASIHFNLQQKSDIVLTNKVLGAVLCGIGLPFDTPLPQAKLLRSK